MEEECSGLANKYCIGWIMVYYLSFRVSAINKIINNENNKQEYSQIDATRTGSRGDII